jgi:diphthamide synthase (EF-2-diphthine--ammonia ligase)
MPVQALLTSVNTATDRIAMHGVRRELLLRQAQALQLPLHTIDLPEMPGMTTYEDAVQGIHSRLKGEGFTEGIFGDIFLEDLRRYREGLLARAELTCCFPIWKVNSSEVVRRFLEYGFKAVVVCINGAVLDKSFCGRIMDESFFRDLPSTIDPCGENGEYHSFVYRAPNFLSEIKFRRGEVVFREYLQSASGFYFCDLLPE